MCKQCGKKPCQCAPYPNKKMSEHDTVTSRTTGRKVEIGMGMNGDGLVPKNPFASKLQSAFAHANPSKFGGKKGLAEWDKATDYKHLPARKAHPTK